MADVMELIKPGGGDGRWSVLTNIRVIMTEKTELINRVAFAFLESVL